MKGIVLAIILVAGLIVGLFFVLGPFVGNSYEAQAVQEMEFISETLLDANDYESSLVVVKKVRESIERLREFPQDREPKTLEEMEEIRDKYRDRALSLQRQIRDTLAVLQLEPEYGYVFVQLEGELENFGLI